MCCGLRVSGGIDERECGAMWRRHVQQWRCSVVQCVCRRLLRRGERTDDLQLQWRVSGRLRVCDGVDERYGDAVWCGPVQRCRVNELCVVSGGSVRQCCGRWSGLQRCVRRGTIREREWRDEQQLQRCVCGGVCMSRGVDQRDSGAVQRRTVQCNRSECMCSVQCGTIRQRERQCDSGLQRPMCSGICMYGRIDDVDRCLVSTRPVLRWWCTVVQCMYRRVLLSNARFAVGNQHHVSVWLRVSSWQLERHVDSVRQRVLLSIGHSQRDCRQVLREWRDIGCVVASQ